MLYSTLTLLAAPALAAAMKVPRSVQEAGIVSFPVEATERPAGIAAKRRRDDPANVHDSPTTAYNNAYFYTVDVLVGTPGQPIKLHLDTGSSEMWVNPTCALAGESEVTLCNSFKRFTPKDSKTFKNLGTPGEIKYGSGAVQMIYGTDTVVIGGASLDKQQFGVATKSTESSTGLLGVGPDTDGFDAEHYPYVLDSLFEQKYINSRAFSLDLRGIDSSRGSITFGGIDTKKFSGPLEKRPILPKEQVFDKAARYTIYLDGVSTTKADGTLVTGFAKKNGLSVLMDSGYSISTLPAAIVKEIAKAFPSANKDTPSSTSWNVDCSEAKREGTVDFTFGDTVINVPYKDFIARSSEDSCLLGFEEADMAVLGDTFLRAAYLVYDYDNRNIHLANNEDCGTNLIAIGKGADAVPAGLMGECGNPNPSTSSAAPSSTTSAAASSSTEQTSTTTEDASSSTTTEDASSSTTTEDANSSSTEAANSSTTEAANSSTTEAANSSSTEAANSSSTEESNSSTTEAANSSSTEAANSSTSSEAQASSTEAQSSEAGASSTSAVVDPASTSEAQSSAASSAASTETSTEPGSGAQSSSASSEAAGSTGTDSTSAAGNPVVTSTAVVIATESATPAPTSTELITSVYTITSCPPEVTNCPVGSVTTKTIKPATTTAPATLTSTITTSKVYTITSCPPEVKNCPVGAVTTEVITSLTTYCPGSAVTTKRPEPPVSSVTSTYLTTKTYTVTECPFRKACTEVQTTAVLTGTCVVDKNMSTELPKTYTAYQTVTCGKSTPGCDEGSVKTITELITPKPSTAQQQQPTPTPQVPVVSTWVPVPGGKTNGTNAVKPPPVVTSPPVVAGASKTWGITGLAGAIVGLVVAAAM